MTSELTDYPPLYEVADGGSLGGQRWYKRMTVVELGFVVVGALASALVAFAELPEQAAAAVTAIAFAGALFARIVTRQRADDHRWFDGRAVAETVKTQTWQYVMRVPPYHADATADRTFGTDLRLTLRERPSVGEFDPTTSGHGQITPQMRELRSLPVAERRELYLRSRLGDQIDWYRRSAARNRQAANRWSLAALVAESIALVAALVAVFSEEVRPLGFVGVLASAAAAFTAWNQLGRHGEVARSYGLAHQELMAIESMGQGATTDAELAALVRDGEGAISREHTMWVAKRADPMASTMLAPQPLDGAETE